MLNVYTRRDGIVLFVCKNDINKVYVISSSRKPPLDRLPFDLLYIA